MPQPFMSAKKFNPGTDYEIDLGPAGNPRQIVHSNVPSLLDPYRVGKADEQFRGRNKLGDTRSAANIQVMT